MELARITHMLGRNKPWKTTDNEQAQHSCKHKMTKQRREEEKESRLYTCQVKYEVKPIIGRAGWRGGQEKSNLNQQIGWNHDSYHKNMTLCPGYFHQSL